MKRERWSGTWTRVRVEEETYLRKPAPDEIRAAAANFRKRWSVLLALHWVAYIALFFGSIAVDFDQTIIMTGFFSLFIHQGVFIVSGFGGFFDRFIAARIGSLPDQRRVRVVEAVPAELVLSEQRLSAHATGEAKERSRGVIVGDEEVAERVEGGEAEVLLEDGRVSMHWVRDGEGRAVLEVRDVRSRARIDIAGFEREPPEGAPYIERNPLELEAGDAAALRDALAFIAGALGLRVELD